MKNRNYRPILGVVLASLFLLICLSPQGRSILTLPRERILVVGESSFININLPALLWDKLDLQVLEPPRSVFSWDQDPSVTIIKNDTGYNILALKPGHSNVSLKLWGYIPLRSMAVESVDARRVVLGGHSIGVVMQSDGIMVVGFASITNHEGISVYPAKDKGIEIGDLITKINGIPVRTENDLAAIIDNNKDSQIIVSIKRGSRIIDIPVKTVFCAESNRYRIGLYVRDGVVGVGTLTFWNPQTKEFAALGHVIVDADTKKGIEVLEGSIVSASIQTVKPGRPGYPGEKIGLFDSNGQIKGDIIKNTDFGIYGTTAGQIENPLFNYAVEVGYAHQVKLGEAQILTVINGTDIEAFTVEIQRVYPERQNGKGMVIKITDPRLLNATGGIIQGMSGSPIIQDNRIIGAITHVFLNDPQKGYGVFIDNMLSEMSLYGNDLEIISTSYLSY